MSYDKIKHLVEVDERILAVFIVDMTGKMQELFIAKDAEIDRSMAETVKSILDLKLETERQQIPSIGNHLWDISEYDKIRVIRIYQANQLIVVLAKSHTAPADTAETVLGYLYESDEEPVSLF